LKLVNINYNNLFIIETLIATSQNGSIANKKDAPWLQIVTSFKKQAQMVVSLKMILV
jgi:hypothetical protein